MQDEIVDTDPKIKSLQNNQNFDEIINEQNSIKKDDSNSQFMLSSGENV